MFDFRKHLDYAVPRDGKVFVGIRIEDDSPKVYFPYGYRGADNPNDFRKDMLNLISILSYYGSKKDNLLSSQDRKTNSFPMHAYIGVFSYFLNFGYYTEKESVFKQSDSGKINWKKTIQIVRPQISNGNPVYLDFVVEKKRKNDNELITQIHKYCVCQSYEKIGCLFGFPKPQQNVIPFDKNLFVSTIQSKISKTFNERDLMLFRNMLDIILYSAEQNKRHDCFYGTYEFDYIWQSLVDTVFGIKKKEDFFPSYQYSKIVNGKKFPYPKQPLFPDTIMILNEGTTKKYYILDAKFYHYGVTKDPTDLPKADSINKQFAYAEFVKTKYKANGKNVYNAFIMPYHSNSDSNDYAFEKTVTLDADWKKEKTSCEKIEGILIDVKSIMYRHPHHSTDDIKLLAKEIERQVK